MTESLLTQVALYGLYTAAIAPTYIMLLRRYLKNRAKTRAGISPEQFAAMKEVKEFLKESKKSLKRPENVLEVLQSRVFPSGLERRSFFFDGSWSHELGSGKYEHKVTYYYWSLPQFPKYLVIVGTWEYGSMKFEVKFQDNIPSLSNKLPTGEPKVAVDFSKIAPYGLGDD